MPTRKESHRSERSRRNPSVFLRGRLEFSV